jgi:NTE family protein
MHAVNLLVMRQLVSDIEHFANRVELIVLPPVCPVTVSSYDFSQTAELVRRAEARTRQWLQRNGLQSRGAPEELFAHQHEHATH